jgi:hypothetical protein
MWYGPKSGRRTYWKPSSDWRSCSRALISYIEHKDDRRAPHIPSLLFYTSRTGYYWAVSVVG